MTIKSIFAAIDMVRVQTTSVGGKKKLILFLGNFSNVQSMLIKNKKMKTNKMMIKLKSVGKIRFAFH